MNTSLLNELRRTDSGSLLRSGMRRRFGWLVLLLLAVNVVAAFAQLNGTYTIGGPNANYASITAAIAALNTSGVSGPVTFTIASGTYNSPTTGWTLGRVTGMSSTNRVTFRPATGASVTIQGDIGSYFQGVFAISRGSYYTIDGSNNGSTSRDMTIIQTGGNDGATVLIHDGSGFNTIMNCKLKGTTDAYMCGVVVIGNNLTSARNDSNTIRNCLIGDTSGVYRNAYGITLFGLSANETITGTKIIDNEIVDMDDSAGSECAAIQLVDYSIGTIIDHNTIHETHGIRGQYLYGISVRTQKGTVNTKITGNIIYSLIGRGDVLNPITTYGIFQKDGSSMTSTTLIANNMIAIESREASFNYGIYLNQSLVGPRDSIYVLHNSIDVRDGDRRGATVRMLQRDGTANNGSLTIADNILYSHIISDNDTVHALYLSRIDGLTCDYNLLDPGLGASINASRLLNTTYRTLAAQKLATAFDVHSIIGNPQFVDPSHGNLHISAARRSAVSGAGLLYTRVSTDIDGTQRLSSPDIGADEGSFLDRLTNDVGAYSVEMPGADVKLRSGTAFTPVAVVENLGTAAQTNIPVRCRIISAATGATIYDDVQTLGLSAGERKKVNFRQNGSVLGSTSLQPGQYVVMVRTELTQPADGDGVSDSLRSPFQVFAPFSGTYTIDPSGSGSRNFTSITEAVSTISDVGISDAPADSAVTFLLASGTYDQTTERFPIIIGSLGATSSRTVTFRPFPDANVVIAAQPQSGAAIELSGCSYVRIDGSTGGSSLKIVNNGTGPAVTFSHDVQHTAIRNLSLLSNNTSTIYGGVVTFESPSGTVLNHYDSVVACTIGDTSGTVNSYSGVVSYGDPWSDNGGYNDILIADNEIVNFCVTSSELVDLFGINVMAGDHWTLYGNKIHNTHMAGTQRVSYTGIYCEGVLNVDIGHNRIFDLKGARPVLTATGLQLYNCGNSIVRNNMVSLAYSDSAIPAQTNGIIWNSMQDGGLKCYHNTVEVAEPGSSGFCLKIGAYSPVIAEVYNNILTAKLHGGGVIQRSGPSVIHFDYNLYSVLIDNNNILAVDDSIQLNPDEYYYRVPWGHGYTQDIHSQVGNVYFRDSVHGDLHIDTAAVFLGEGVGAPSSLMGTPYPEPLDIDYQPRDTVTTDMGADDGDYNGGGIAIITPNGGEEYPVDYALGLVFTTNRPLMDVRAEISIDDGKTWTQCLPPTHLANAGRQRVIITTPDTMVSTARVRIISQKNHWEADTSDRAFSLVRPRFVVRQPNGGEVLVPTDTFAIRWTNEFMLPDFKAQLDYSVDGGSTWHPITTGLTGLNLPDTNSFDWEVADAPTARAKVRAKLVGSSIADVSDTTFTILPKPNIEIKTPNGERNLFVGEPIVITWTSVTTANIRIDYTTDGGRTWLQITTTRIPAEIGSFPWRVPDTPSDSVLVRIVNVERPRFSDVSDHIFSIKHASVTVLSPNGGEAYELNEAIPVRWRQNDIESLNIEYSSDYGTTWKILARSVPAAAGSYSIIPPSVPTRLALVRLTDAAHDWVSDYSDRPFQIMPPKGIVIFTPAVGDELIRRSTYVINWRADRVDMVDLRYSLDNGATWNVIAAGVPAAQGSYVWSVPNQLTDQGLIRIDESGGSAFAVRSYFRIINAKQPVVKVIKPNGGERYTSGDDIVIQWSATSDITFMSLSYSSDDGATWNPIVANLAAVAGQYVWKNALPAGTRYRIKADGVIVADISDGPFTVAAKVVPTIRVIGPNGGEVFTVGAATQVIWTATNVNGQALVDYSTDDGVTWSPIGAAAASTGVIAWTIPSSVTDKGRVRVVAADNSAQDASDDRFSIKGKLAEPLRVVTPNTGAEIWTSGESRGIVWQAPADVTQVKLSYSLDGGSTWSVIATVASVSGTNTSQWTVPMVASETRLALIKVEDASDASRSDISDNPFTIRSGVTTGVVRSVETGSALALISMVPNPGRDETMVRWMQPSTGMTLLRLTDELGRVVREEFINVPLAGEQTRMLRLAGLAGGVYYVTIEHGWSELHAMLVIAR